MLHDHAATASAFASWHSAPRARDGRRRGRERLGASGSLFCTGQRAKSSGSKGTQTAFCGRENALIESEVTSWTANPYLHYEESRIYNPLTDRALLLDEHAYRQFRIFQEHGVADAELIEAGWIIPAEADLSRRFRLKIVSLETV